MAKNNRQFRQFLRQEVNLNQDRLHRLQVSVRDVNRHLKGNLPGYQRIDRQGSYGLDTLVKPVNEDDEYDADIQVVMNPNPNWKARDYLDALGDTLAREHNFADKIELGNRCVTLNYAGIFTLTWFPASPAREDTSSATGRRTASRERTGRDTAIGSRNRAGSPG